MHYSVQAVETGQKDHDADDVEVEMDHGGAAGVLVRAHRGEQRRHTGADVLAHDDGDGAAVGDDTGGAQGLQDADAGTGALDDASDQCTHQNAEALDMVVMPVIRMAKPMRMVPTPFFFSLLPI